MHEKLMLSDEQIEDDSERRPPPEDAKELGQAAVLGDYLKVFGVDLMTQIPYDAVSDTGSNPISTNLSFDTDNDTTGNPTEGR